MEERENGETMTDTGWQNKQTFEIIKIELNN